MFYSDDSGSVDTGFVVYSWIELPVDQWKAGLRAWLDLRKRLYRDYAIPADKELHSTKFVNGRARISTNPTVNTSKSLRTEVMELALETIGNTEGLTLGTAYRRTTALGPKYHAERVDVYRKLIDHLDDRLASSGELGMIFMDGNGTDQTYQKAHRELKLANRSIIEDPMFQGAHNSQWIQMADIVAYASYQHLLRHEAKKFAWSWYDDYLKGSDHNNGPIAI
ncbi:hypothetical protein B2J88_50585 [Rhodococcus sp. SRB_17]|nr:hypothetical protein [Rhodococcus sp. SRB_17]